MHSERPFAALAPALLLAAVAVLAGEGCGLSLPEGIYGCEPADPATCPPGWHCGADLRCRASSDGGGDVDVPTEGDGDDSVDGGCDPTSCDDGNACNGVEACTIDGACVQTRPPADGAPCDRAAGPGHVVPGHCFVELCRPETCGNSITDSGEDCDDGNLVDGDGCDADCTVSCNFTEECDDGNACNGTEGCTGHRCVPGAAQLPDGTSCGDGLVCTGALCVPSWCGDGGTAPSTGEECDDGNDVTGDGCDPDCSWSCHTEADCSDLELCSGTELCDTETHACEPGIPAADGTPCLRSIGESGACRVGTCAGLDCGDGVVDPDEDCDDGNTTAGDGCEANCLWSCRTDAECSDLRTCDGIETCDPTEHRCLSGTPPPDGTECNRDTNPATREICLGGSCNLSICGDGFLDAVRLEECDDGNAVAGDGCEATTCTFSCGADADCGDEEACNGVETCDPASHACAPGAEVAGGTLCTMPGGEAGGCRSGSCVRRACGNGLLDPGEECDDGNLVVGDGCEASCLFSCHAGTDCREVPDDPCSSDSCATIPGGQRCERAFSTDACDDGDPCTADDVCDGAGVCRGRVIDADGDTYGPGAACGADCNDRAAGVHPGATETCNAADDDCNGVSDDGAGMTCIRGIGRSCLAAGSGGTTCVGTESCTASCVWTGSCVVTATETCNAADDDCDGLIDEGFACVLGRTETCTTLCGGSGSRTCGVGCTWGPCGGSLEVACNGCDDDGDGVTDEGTWCRVTGLPSTGDFLAIHGTAANDVWIVGQAGLILHWNGTTWSSVASGTTRALRSVWTMSSSAAWCAGDGGVILSWNGTAWATQASGTTSDLFAVWASSAMNAWAAGDDGRMLHFVASGWSPVMSGTGSPLRALRGSASDDILAAGDGETIRWWNGTAWSDRSDHAPRADFYALAGFVSTEMWVGGTSGAIARWNESRWTSTPAGTGNDILGMRSLGAGDAWYVGQGGICGRWDGTRWTATISGTSQDLHGVWGASAREVWAVGRAGTLVRRRE
jgi:cysteine-rich repeat protein